MGLRRNVRGFEVIGCIWVAHMNVQALVLVGMKGSKAAGEASSGFTRDVVTESGCTMVRKFLG